MIRAVDFLIRFLKRFFECCDHSFSNILFFEKQQETIIEIDEISGGWVKILLLIAYPRLFTVVQFIGKIVV